MSDHATSEEVRKLRQSLAASLKLTGALLRFVADQQPHRGTELMRMLTLARSEALDPDAHAVLSSEVEALKAAAPVSASDPA